MPSTRLIALAVALLALGCAGHTDPPRAAAVVAAPAPAPAPPPTWPDAAPAPDAVASASGPEAEPETFSARAELPDVHFASGQIRVQRRDLATLDAVVAWLKANPTQLLIVEGHTDAAGPRAANLDLARRRARWVVDHLVARGVPAERITAVARGESETLCVDESTACRHRNRRVHFLARDREALPQLSATPIR